MTQIAADARGEQPTTIQARALRYVTVLVLLAGFAAIYARSMGAGGMFLWDEAEYACIARSLVRGQGFWINGQPNAIRPPVLPLATAASMLLSKRQTDTVAKVPSIVFALLAMWIVYVCAARHLGHLTGLVAAFLLAVEPAFWTLTANLLTEMPFMAFFAGAVLCLHAGLHHHPRYFAYSWLCFALALLTRYTALLFGPVALLLTLAALFWRDPEVNKRLRSWQFLLSPLLAVVVLAPWFVRQQMTFGDAFVGIKYASGQLAAYVPGTSMPWHFYLASLPRMLSPAVLVLVVIGLLYSIKQRNRLAVDCCIAIAFVLLYFSVARYKEVRLVTSILPLTAILAAIGLTKPLLGTRLQRLVTPLVVLVLGGVFAMNYRTTQKTLDQIIAVGYPPFLDALHFVREHSWGEAVIVGASVPQISWYTDRPVVDFPDESKLAQALYGTDYVVATNFERGQREYVRTLMLQLAKKGTLPGEVSVFHDARFAAVVIRSDFLRLQLSQ